MTPEYDLAHSPCSKQNQLQGILEAFPEGTHIPTHTRGSDSLKGSTARVLRAHRAVPDSSAQCGSGREARSQQLLRRADTGIPHRSKEWEYDSTESIRLEKSSKVTESNLDVCRKVGRTKHSSGPSTYDSLCPQRARRGEGTAVSGSAAGRPASPHGPAWGATSAPPPSRPAFSVPLSPVPAGPSRAIEAKPSSRTPAGPSGRTCATAAAPRCAPPAAPQHPLRPAPPPDATSHWLRGLSLFCQPHPSARRPAPG